MSFNKGKDGELRASIVVARIGLCTDGVDFTRPTTTNTADQGADLFMTHPHGFLKQFAEVAGSALPPPESGEQSIQHPGKPEKSRIDVKTTTQKLQKDVVEKFISDIHNHPNCLGHILMGGEDLTGPARREFMGAQSRFSEKGKTLLYVQNEGIDRLEAHYQPQIEDSFGDGNNEKTSD